MNPQLMQAIMALLGGQGVGSQFNTTAAQFAPQSGQSAESLNTVGNFSPVNTNPTYASTVGRFFENSPLAGARPFTPQQPLQPGLSGSHASRGRNYWSSIGSQNHGATMQSIMDALSQNN